MAIVLAYIFYFTAASISPIQRRWLATQDVNHSGQIHFAAIVTFVIAALSPLLLIFQPFYLSGNPVILLGLALAGGFFGAGYFVSIFTAQGNVEAGLSTLVMNIYTPITIILASLFLNEKLTIIQIIGTALLLIGMVIVGKKHKIGKVKFDKYFMLMLVGGIMLGLALTAERALQKITGFTAGAMILWSSEFMFLAIATIITRSKSYYSIKNVVLTGFFRYLQQVSWVALVFIVGNVSIVSAITTFKVVVIFIAAAIFLKEKEDLPRKMIGSLIAVLGLLIM